MATSVVMTVGPDAPDCRDDHWEDFVMAATGQGPGSTWQVPCGMTDLTYPNRDSSQTTKSGVAQKVVNARHIFPLNGADVFTNDSGYALTPRGRDSSAAVVVVRRKSRMFTNIMGLGVQVLGFTDQLGCTRWVRARDIGVNAGRWESLDVPEET